MRDDLPLLEDHPSTKPALTGNKARKLYYYLQNDFPGVSRVVSYGSAQSNMLYSLAVLAKIKGWRLEFYVDRLPGNLGRHPRGNYAEALALGAQVKIVPLDRSRFDSTTDSFIRESVVAERSDTLFIPLGGTGPKAETGLKILADEIGACVEEHQLKNPKLMLPSGTGTTAFYLQKHLPFEVLTCTCVGSADYLESQFKKHSNNKKIQPTILSQIADESGRPRKFHFGKLYPEFYKIWEELRLETSITFELLYDPLGWLHMLDYIKQSGAGEDEPNPDMIYLHQGGQLGNETMLQRYARKQGLVSNPDHK